MVPARFRLASSAALAVLLTACVAAEGGIGLPQQLAGETYPGKRSELSGSVEVAPNGCIEVVIGAETFFVIWPRGSSLDDVVRLPNGDVLAPGDGVHGIGGFTRVEPLVADRAGYWANVLGFCAPDADAVLVFDAAERQR